MLEQIWNAGFTVAAHLLNKCWRDSMGVLPDDEQAELWFRRAAEAGHDFSQYALGKLLQSQKRMDEAVSRYEKAAAQDNSYADCWLGKLYFEGKAVSKDVPGAVDHLTASAEQGNQYAQYMVGKLHLTGQGLPRDQAQAMAWFSRSAAQGNQYAQFFLEQRNDLRPPSVMLAVTQLLCHMSRIFQDNSVPPAIPMGQVDRKLRRKIQEKKIAMGHKPDDHEEQWPDMTM